MTTRLKLGPADKGTPLTYEEFCRADYQEGYRYELIEGRLDVSPVPNMPCGFLETWLLLRVSTYWLQHPEVVTYVGGKSRIFIPDLPDETCPEPDLAAYNDVPESIDLASLDWRDYSPILVGEILDPDEPDKDLVRNVRLYRQVPTIQEYWIIDPRPDPNKPKLIVHRRTPTRWRVLRRKAGETYTTPLLPDFELTIDPRR